VNVVEKGAVGDNSTDNADLLQALVDAAEPGTVFYFPRGIYRLTKSLDFSGLSNFSLIGEVQTARGIYGATIIGAVNGPLIDIDYGTGAGTFRIYSLNVANDSRSGGTAIYTKNAVLASFERVSSGGASGIILENPFHTSIHNAVLGSIVSEYGPGGCLIVDGGIGTSIDSADFMGCDDALRAAGPFTLYGSRFEVNVNGIVLGSDATGQAAPAYNVYLAGITMEANDISINLRDCEGCGFAGISSQGSTNAPSGQSDMGVWVEGGFNNVFAAVGMGGTYSDTAMIVDEWASNVHFANSAGWNGFSNGGTSWRIDNATTTQHAGW